MNYELFKELKIVRWKCPAHDWQRVVKCSMYYFLPILRKQMDIIAGSWVNMIVWIVVLIQQSCQLSTYFWNVPSLNIDRIYAYLFCLIIFFWLIPDLVSSFIFNCMSFWTFYFIKWPVRKMLDMYQRFFVTYMLDL